MRSHTTDDAPVTEPDTDIRTASPTERFESKVETEAPCVRRVTITVDPAHVAATRRKEGKKLGKTVRIKGFRKGKVPPHVIQERYGPLIDERTLTALVNEGYRAAVVTHGLAAVGEPAVDDVDYDPGARLSFSVDVEVMPEISLARTGGFRVERPKVSVEESDIDKILEEMRGEQAVLEPVDRAARSGDVVSVMITPADGEEDGDASKPYRFELGAGYAIPDVEKAIGGLVPGGDGVFDVTYPPDFGNEELAGATRSLHIALTDVKAKRLPDLDDEFARQVGDFDALDELRAAIREDLVKHREREAGNAVREQLVQALVDANPFEVPPGLVSRYVERVIDAPDDADPARVEEAKRSVRPAVERQVKRDLAIERLIEMKGFEAGREEVDARLQEIADRNEVSVSEVRQRLAREKQLDGVRRDIALEKVFALLEEGSEIR